MIEEGTNSVPRIRRRKRRGEVVAVKPQRNQREGEVDPDAIPGARVLTAEEGAVFFDRQVRKLLDIFGEEFLRRCDAGEYRPFPDTPEGRKIGRLVMMIPCAQ